MFRYTYTVDNPNIITVIAKDSYFAVYGADPGATKMYIKKNGVTVSTVTYKVWPLSTVSIKYEFTTSATANYLNVSPVLYGHNGLGTLNMKATLLNMNLYKKGDNINYQNPVPFYFCN